MPPKGGNAKKESGRAKKAENEEKKKEAAAAAKEAKEANEWADGSKSGKSSKEEKEEKRRQEAAKKAERERLLAEEEASIASAKPKAAPKAGAKKGAASASGASSSKKAKEKEVPAGPGAIAAGGGLGAISSSADDEHKLVESFAATGIDDALDLLTVINAKADKASVGQAAAGLERHPERRFKAAFEAYQERELPIIKKDHPGLRLNQYKDLLFKQFQKSPDNPFNQVVVDYNASKEDKVSALKGQRDTVAERLRQE